MVCFDLFAQARSSSLFLFAADRRAPVRRIALFPLSNEEERVRSNSRRCIRPIRSDRASQAGIAGLLALCALLFSAVGASADPSISDKRAQAQAILREVESLDDKLGAAAERFNGANYELQQVSQRLAETRTDLVRARELRKASQRRVASRLRQLYINGDGGSEIEVLLGARSLPEVLDRLDLVERVSQQDAAIAEEAQALRERVANREEQLSAARARQAAVVEQRATERRSIEGTLSARRQLLASVEDEIARLEEAERQRQAELRRQARLDLARQQAAAAAAQRARDAATAPVGHAAPPDTAIETPVSEGGETGGAAPPPADASAGARVVAIAMRYLGTPYKWGGASPSGGFDCSGLTMYVFAQIGVSLPHYAAAQYGMGAPVPKEQLQPGDLVFFRGLGHMGMYIGGGNFIHAPRTGDVVKISSLSESYYLEGWVGARRVL